MKALIIAAPGIQDQALRGCSNCGGKIKAKGLCEKHYRAAHYRTNAQRVKRQGAAWYSANRTRKQRTRRAYYESHIDIAAKQSAARYRANKASILSRQRERRAIDPEPQRQCIRAWGERNRPLKRSYVRKYQAAKLRATPGWANEFFISEIYELAELRTRLLGVPHEVDHIVPLQGKTVCGLHVEHNLQVITRAANIAKGNAVWPGMP